MPAQSSDSSHDGRLLTLERRLRVLTPQLIAMIDQALAGIGEFGTVSLVVKDGKVRFIEVTRSIEVAESDRKLGHSKPLSEKIGECLLNALGNYGRDARV